MQNSKLIEMQNKLSEKDEELKSKDVRLEKAYRENKELEINIGIPKMYILQRILDNQMNVKIKK